MSDIEWIDGAVCYACDCQWFCNDVIGRFLFCESDFQLNEIRIGDYIEKSELDTEQKYNNVVEVFGLFGFGVSVDCEWSDSDRLVCNRFYIDAAGDLDSCRDSFHGAKRKLTYNQLMAIGKLKRMMDEKFAPKTAPEVGADEWIDSSEAPAKTSVEYLNECIEVQKERGEQYDSSGTGERSFAAAAQAFNALTGKGLKGSDVCLILTCVKAVRQYSNPERLHEDSLIDGVSYLSLWAEELNKEIK